MKAILLITNVVAFVLLALVGQPTARSTAQAQAEDNFVYVPLVYNAQADQPDEVLPTQTASPGGIETYTPTSSRTPVQTRTMTPTPTLTFTPMPTETSTPTPTLTETSTPTPTIILECYHLDISVDGKGAVVRDAELPSYPAGTIVTLAAVAAPGYALTSWSGDLSGDQNPATLVIDADKTVTAHFARVSLPKDLIEDDGVRRESFESMTGWTVAGTSGADYSAELDTVHHKDGGRSLRLSPPAGGYVEISKTVNWNLSVPADQGNFRFWVYVDGPTEPTGGYIILANDSQYNNYFITYLPTNFTFRNRPGWNLVSLRSSDWIVGGGSPSWSSRITQIRFRFYGADATTYALDWLTSRATAIPAVLFTFDDGDHTLWEQAYAYMATRNVRGTGYIATDLVGIPDFVTWEQLQKMYADGWTIGNHTKAHLDLTTLSLAGQQAALLDARTALNEHGLTNADYVAYPYGSYNADTLTAMANLSMRSGRTVNNGYLVSPLMQPYELTQRAVRRSATLATAKSLVDNAVARQEILVITLHDISSSPMTDGWYTDRFQALVDYCIELGVPILTMDDLYRLQTADITIPTAR